MCVLRGGEEEQTPGASVSGLRPWRQGLTALTEVATNADVQTPLSLARTHSHTLQQRRARTRRRQEAEEEKRQGGKLGASLGEPMNSGRSCHCFSAFSDQDVFICTDQNRAEVI